MWRYINLCVCPVFIFLTVYAPPNRAQAFAFGQLGKIEVVAGQELRIAKWHEILKKINRERSTYSNCTVAEKSCTQPPVAQWQKFLMSLSTLSWQSKVEKVNRFINRIPYQEDQKTYGKSDYWASPLEFLGNAGDCEDYAIAKYVSLRQLGLPATELKMVVLQDTLRDLAHAVLAVRIDGSILVLDNNSNHIASPKDLPHYSPYYAVNENQQWYYYERRQRLTAEYLVPAIR